MQGGGRLAGDWAECGLQSYSATRGVDVDIISGVRRAAADDRTDFDIENN